METTHEQKVKMLQVKALRNNSLDDVNRMWLTLMKWGTPEARAAFDAAAQDAGFVLMATMLWADRRATP